MRSRTVTNIVVGCFVFVPVGWFFPSNPVRRAYRLFANAADQGDTNAQRILGLMYVTGRGIPQDYVAAHMWLNLAAAAASGDDQKNAATLRDETAAKMTPQQIAEAQRLAREWKPVASK